MALLVVTIDTEEEGRWSSSYPTAGNTCANISLMLAIVVVMLLIDWQLTLLTFVTLPFLFVLVEYARRLMRASFRQIRVRLAAMNAFAQAGTGSITGTGAGSSRAGCSSTASGACSWDRGWVWDSGPNSTLPARSARSPSRPRRSA